MTLRQSLRQSSLSKPQEAEEEGLQEREAGPGRGGGHTRRPRGARKRGLDAVALCMGAKRHLLRLPAHLPVRESCEVCPIHPKPQTDDYGNVECLHTGVFSSGHFAAWRLRVLQKPPNYSAVYWQAWNHDACLEKKKEQACVQFQV